MPEIPIGVACPNPGERATFLDWLSDAGYAPIPMLDLDGVARDINLRPIEVLIADAALVPHVELPRIVRILGGNRPLVLVGAAGTAPEAVPRDATWVERPVTRTTFLLSVALALAEGRPARCSPRRGVPKLSSTVDGVAARVMDISAEGVRLEVAAPPTVTLPPYFTLQVPGFGVVAKVKRVWVAMPAGSMWCGGIIDHSLPRATATWNHFVEVAPSRAEIINDEARQFK